jgi:hypothetical protein
LQSLDSVNVRSPEQATELYRDILKAIQLTPNQRQQMLELRRRFLRRYGAILQDRQRIAGRLQVSSSNLLLDDCSLP